MAHFEELLGPSHSPHIVPTPSGPTHSPKKTEIADATINQARLVRPDVGIARGCADVRAPRAGHARIRERVRTGCSADERARHRRDRRARARRPDDHHRERPHRTNRRECCRFCARRCACDRSEWPYRYPRHRGDARPHLLYDVAPQHPIQLFFPATLPRQRCDDHPHDRQHVPLQRVESQEANRIGASAAVSAPAGARVIDLNGHTVIPGIVGMHDHTFYTTSRRSIQSNFSFPRLYLASGVTTIRTTGSMSPYSELNLKKRIEAGEVPGPRMHVTGPYISGDGAGGGMYEVGTPEDARRVVNYWVKEGATWFKFYTSITRDEMKAAIDEAHKHGVKLTGHLCSVGSRDAAAVGLDALEHGLFANSEYDANKTPDKCPSTMSASHAALDVNSPEVKATFAEMVRNNVAMTSTLAVYELFVPNRPPELDARML